MHGQTQKSHTFGKFESFINRQFSRSLSSLRPITLLCSPWLICRRTLPWGVHAHPSQDGSRSEGFWEEQDSHGLAFSLEFRPEKPVCACAVPPLSQKSGAEIPEPFTHTGACLLFVLAVTISLGVDKRRALAIYSLLLFPFQRANRRLIKNA